MRGSTDFEGLMGSKVSGVCFVRDYVELHFHGPVLRCLSAPLVIAHGDRFQFPRAGSREALCRLIDCTVANAEDQHDRLALCFGDDLGLEIPKASEGAGPEVAHFVPTREGRLDVASMMIWENLVPTHSGPRRGGSQ